MSEDSKFDVVVIGGAFSGASLAILLKRRIPLARIAIVERSVEFDRKVGESTSEVAGAFLTRVLKFSTYLSQNHIIKNGLRLWFSKPENECMNRCSEIGAKFQTRLPTFQIDRSKLDLAMLEEARKLGCEILRPATVRELELGGTGKNRIRIKAGAGERELTAKWVIDASGKAALIGRKRGTIKELDAHPTNSIWARFRNVRDIDGYEIADKFPGFAETTFSSRGTATNHLMGRGWWCWIIPLKNGDISAGVTYDRRIYEPPAGASLSERLKSHLVSHPVGRELFENADPIEKDTRSYSQLAYYSTEPSGDGWLAVGDAAGFMDPLYSHGLDYSAYSVYWAHDIVARSLQGECVRNCVDNYRKNYLESYHRWFAALYKDKYYYIGDHELTFAAFLLDLSLYFFAPVNFTYFKTHSELCSFPYGGRIGGAFAKFMGFYNRRFVKIAQKRHAAGVYGKRNLNHRSLVEGFSPGFAAKWLFLRGMAIWLSIEIRSLFLRASATVAPEGVNEAPVVASRG